MKSFKSSNYCNFGDDCDHDTLALGKAPNNPTDCFFCLLDSIIEAVEDGDYDVVYIRGSIQGAKKIVTDFFVLDVKQEDTT